MKTTITFSLVVFALLLSACGPSQAEEEAAIATQVALLIEQEQTSQAEQAQPTSLPAGEGAAPAGEDGPPPEGSTPLPPEASCTPGSTERVTATVTDVWSGQSIQVSLNGQSFEVRYIGIDAPDGDASREANRQLVEGKEVLLIRDVTDVDEYGRLARYVIADGVFVNFELVRQGAAFPSPEEPDLACEELFSQAQP